MVKLGDDKTVTRNIKVFAAIKWAIITMFVLLMVAIVFVSTADAADDLVLEINGISMHGTSSYTEDNGDQRYYNQRNIGAGLQYTISDHLSADVGTYKNSYYRNTWYTSINAHHTFRLGILNIAPGLSAGLVTGYNHTPMNAHPVQLMAMPTLTAGFGSSRVRFGYLPATGDGTTSIVTAQFLMKLGDANGK